MTQKTRTATLITIATVVGVVVVALIVYGILLATTRRPGASAATTATTPSSTITQNPTVRASATPTQRHTATQPTPSSVRPLIDGSRPVTESAFGDDNRAAFFTPGHKAYCELDRQGVTCDLSYRLPFHPGDGKRPCQAGELVNDGASLGADGATFGQCRSDMPLRDICPQVKPGDLEEADCKKYNQTPQLQGGTRITLGDYTCAAGRTGAVECITEQHGFLVTPKRYAVH